jgi:hypothetical protein
MKIIIEKYIRDKREVYLLVLYMFIKIFDSMNTEILRYKMRKKCVSEKVVECIKRI